MAAFVVRRFIGMILVLVVVSFFVFLIFIVVPGGDPAVRIAGRTATDQNIENIRQDWGFDQPFYVQYYDMMKKAFTNDLYEQTHQGVSVVDQIKQGVPATFSLAIGAAFIWLTFGILVGVISAVTAGQGVGPLNHGARADRHLDAGVLARHHRALLPRREEHVVPGRRLRAADARTRRSGSTT